MKEINVLILDDEKNARWSLSKGLSNLGYSAFPVENEEEANQTIIQKEISIILLDINLGKINGINLIKKFLEINPDIKIIMVTAYNDAKRALESIRAGAFDYIAKPYELDEIDISIQRALKMTSLENEIETYKIISGNQIPEIIGNSSAIMDLKKIISKTFNNDAPVLITGESGTGKELIARSIYSNSLRKNGPFIAANVSALPDNLLEAELFGYEKGAFTGAVKSRKGYFELADKGVIFLDEIGEMSPLTQVKLLRVLETKEINILGAEKNKLIDTRIICATNRNIINEVKEQNFREDLFYRISVFHIHIPPLRERGQDLELLADYFVKDYCKKKSICKTISKKALKKLYNHSWPGNVRELFHVLERAILVSDTKEIDDKDIQDFPSSSLDFNQKIDLTKLVEVYEKNIIARVLKENNENQLKTSQALGLTRTSLIYKLKKYNFLTRDDENSTPD